MQKAQRLFCNFASGETDRTFRMNSREKGVTGVYLKMYSFTFAGAFTTAFVLDIDEMAMKINSENLAGYPVPVGNHTNGPGGEAAFQVFERPLLLAIPSRGAIQQMRIRLRNLNGTPFSHTGFSLWIDLATESEEWDGEYVRNDQWQNPKQMHTGAGKNDWRWDYIPTVDEVEAQRLARLSKAEK